MEIRHTLDKAKIHAMVDARVSQTAAMEYGDDGESLFDSILVHSNERERIEEYMLSSLATLVVRNAEEAALSADGDSDVLVIRVPDFDGSLESKVHDLIDSYVADRCTALWMRRVCKDREDEYSTVAEAELNSVSQMIHTRKRPMRIRV